MESLKEIRESLECIMHSKYVMSGTPVRLISPNVGMINIVGDVIDVYVKPKFYLGRHYIISKAYSGKYGFSIKHIDIHEGYVESFKRLADGGFYTDYCCFNNDRQYKFLNLCFNSYNAIVKHYSSESASFVKVKVFNNSIRLFVQINNKNNLYKVTINKRIGYDSEKTILTIINGMIITTKNEKFSKKEMNAIKSGLEMIKDEMKFEVLYR